MAVDLTKLTAAAEKITTVKGSILAFLNGVPQLIRDAVAADDMADATNINALADRLEAEAGEITTALAAHTPAEPEPEPTPEPTPEG